MKFADGFDTECEDGNCPNGYNLVFVQTKYNHNIIAICINDNRTELRIYTANGGFHSVPIRMKNDKQLIEDYYKVKEERDDARRAYDELKADVMNMENEIETLKDKLFVAKYCCTPLTRY